MPRPVTGKAVTQIPSTGADPRPAGDRAGHRAWLPEGRVDAGRVGGRPHRHAGPHQRGSLPVGAEYDIVGAFAAEAADPVPAGPASTPVVHEVEVLRVVGVEVNYLDAHTA